MSIETDIRTALATALVPATANGVSVGSLEKGYALPWVCLRRVSTRRRQALGSGSPVISSAPLFQFDLWAEDSLTAEPVMEALRTAVLALPHAVVLVSENGRSDASSGYWHGQLDVRVSHAGA